MIKYFKNISADDKTGIIVKNIVLSGIVKCVSILTNFLSVPLILGYLNTTKYGVWLTISSILGWFTMLDLGIGNGLRNRIAEAQAANDPVKIRGYVSTTYLFTSAVFFAVWLIFLCIYFFVNWAQVFNAPAGLEHEIRITVFISILFLCLQYVFRLITTILLAFHKPATADIINTSGQIIILPLLYLLSRWQVDSLIYTAIIVTSVPLLILSAATIYYFSTSLSYIRPSLKLAKKEHLGHVMHLGFRFFIIQAAALVMYSTDNIIITQLYDPESVAVYNIAFKYFSILNFVFAIVLNPVWSMATKAYVQGDIKWLKTSLSKIKLVWVALSALGVIQLLLSKTVYSLWIGTAIRIPWELSATLCVYFIIMTYTNIYATMLNGLGKIKLQLIFSIISMIINIPLCIYFAKYLGLGIKGVAIATILSMILSAIVSTWQLNNVLQETDRK